MSRPLNLVAYCRVSTENQKEEGKIEAQVEYLTQYCKDLKHCLIEVFLDDGVSGSLECRPGLTSMWDYIENNPGIDGVVVYKLDRLARDLYIQEHLIRKLENLKVKLMSTKEPNLDSKDPMRLAFRQFMGITAQLERSFITMRMTDGRMRKAAGGGYAGGSPAMGFSVNDKELSIDSKKAEVIKEIFYLKRYQRWSMGQIADEMNRRETPTARGGKWYRGTIRYILNNKKYWGVMVYKDSKFKRPDLSII